MQTLTQILSPGRTICRAPGGSKKRLFETIARIISEDQLSLPYAEVFTQLIAREKLGSTGLGQGIAIPHCRIPNCSQPLGTLLSVDEPVDFDAPDNQPVDLLFVLLVPQEAHQEHLDILSHVAGLFSQTEFCQALRAAGDNQALYDIATGWKS
ncbi:PTS IIA-like nitrogen regulatory protein PtsN [Parahaliea aestuarii]|uniref:PTS IIA-like nitrogen regulatory protein PtsN n=1 Tax=Parahaliea aestuarii TaxID=1852021 RepID=A0A5C9A2E9_9GAMM|nr:PTS IIA-like nitrogen regulatory protein PtsN [Parahaliea aestuarii]TXS94896.1 PTS IIA-like nitrogen regulatory protein PtsN [Parahaliea aestuarii]